MEALQDGVFRKFRLSCHPPSSKSGRKKEKKNAGRIFLVFFHCFFVSFFFWEGEGYDIHPYMIPDTCTLYSYSYCSINVFLLNYSVLVVYSGTYMSRVPTVLFIHTYIGTLQVDLRAGRGTLRRHAMQLLKTLSCG